MPQWVREVLCAFAFTCVAVILRLLVNQIAPNAAPFALVYPASLVATLVAGWRSGLLALAMLTWLSWTAVIRGNDDGAVSTVEAVNLILYVGGALIAIVVAEGFRRAHERTRQERADRLSEHQLLLQELNHRVKNNFQMVASLLEMQRRRASDSSTSVALEDALRRVRSMAQAQIALYHDPTNVSAVEVNSYLNGLCDSLADSLLLTGDVRLECQAEPALLSRDRAVALGMVVNELVTNAAKYAFPVGGAGLVKVDFSKVSEGWRLVVSDNGVGMRADTVGSGLGKRIIEAFAKQAGGSISTGAGPGVTVVLDLPA